MRRLVLAVVLSGVMVAGAAPALAKSVGGCPDSASDKWELVEVASLYLPPGGVTGIASIDGNGDGLTCIKPLVPGGLVLRDNTVGN